MTVKFRCGQRNDLPLVCGFIGLQSKGKKERICNFFGL